MAFRFTTSKEYLIRLDTFEPAYMALYHSGELHRRLEDALASLGEWSAASARGIAKWTIWPTKPRPAAPAATNRWPVTFPLPSYSSRVKITYVLPCS